MKKKKALIIICSTMFLLIIAGISIYFLTKDNTKKKPPIVTETEKESPKAEENNATEISPYTGEKVTKEVYDHTAFMAIIENDTLARPLHLGVSQADIMFETMAEGGIPRFMGIFHKNQPSVIGPIRSARPYFLDLSISYNLPFAHCGGSEEAKNRIKKENLLSLDEMANTSTYWRDKTKGVSFERTLRTSSQKVVDLINKKGYNKTPKNLPEFNASYFEKPELPMASTVNLKINTSYSTNYTYKDNLYYKSMDGVDTFDNENKSLVSCKNIVIQITDIHGDATNYRQIINLVGKGEGYVISNGKYTKMKWSKASLSSPTILKDEAGNTITLSPGNTWWHILANSAKIDIK